MEDENRVFGFDAGNEDEFGSDEKIDFHNKNKEDAKKNIEALAKDLTDFFDMVSKDVPDPSEEEIKRGIEKILAKTHPEEIKAPPAKTSKSRKVTLRVLFVAALLAIVSFSCLFVIGTSHNINIENGFVTFAKDTVKIVLFGEEKEKYITIDALLADLNFHGYSDLMFSQEFVTKSDEYKVSVPEYIIDTNSADFNEQVEFAVYSDTCEYSFSLINNEKATNVLGDFVHLDDADTVVIDDTHIYVFKMDTGFSVIRFKSNGIEYMIDAEVSLPEMIEFAKTFVKME